MNLKGIGKILKKLGKSKVTKEVADEVTEETLSSITSGLLKRNKELLNNVGNQWKKEAIDTAGALSHLPKIKSTPKGALRNKGESVFSKTPLRVTQRTGKYKTEYVKNYRDNAEKANIKPKKEIKNRRKGNKEIKKIPVNRSTQQEQQLLLEAPVQKEPRKPRR